MLQPQPAHFAPRGHTVLEEDPSLSLAVQGRFNHQRGKHLALHVLRVHFVLLPVLLRLLFAPLEDTQTPGLPLALRALQGHTASVAFKRRVPLVRIKTLKAHHHASPALQDRSAYRVRFLLVFAIMVTPL